MKTARCGDSEIHEERDATRLGKDRARILTRSVVKLQRAEGPQTNRPASFGHFVPQNRLLSAS
jgi:hypothetical protein